MTRSKSGFTIVELLIVIVVIAILATISAVAYNGIQQRANNTKTITAVNQVVKAISGYIAENGEYPHTSATNTAYCVVPAKSTNTCVQGSTFPSNTTLTNNLQTISTLPSSVPDAHPNSRGIIYYYAPSNEFNGDIRPASLYYSLKGESQQCGVANVAEVSGGSYVSSTTGWSINDGGNTICMVFIMGS